jgi:hypothetical protein
LWIAQECARQTNALFLAAGEREAFGPQARGVARGQRGDEVVDLGVAAGGFDLGVGSRGDGQRDVGADGAFVEGGFLRDEGELGPVDMGWELSRMVPDEGS